MKKVLIGLAIFVGVVVFALFIFSTLFPQMLADFVMGVGVVNFDFEHEGETRSIEFTELGEGVTRQDRLFVMQKLMAVILYTETTPDRSWIRNEFQEMVLAASEDKALSASELEELRQYRSDIITDDMIANWIKLAKDFEEERSRRSAEEESR